MNFTFVIPPTLPPLLSSQRPQPGINAIEVPPTASSNSLPGWCWCLCSVQLPDGCCFYEGGIDETQLLSLHRLMMRNVHRAKGCDVSDWVRMWFCSALTGSDLFLRWRYRLRRPLAGVFSHLHHQGRRDVWSFRASFEALLWSPN